MARLREILPTDYEAIAIKFAPHHICAAAKRFCFLAFGCGQTAGAEAILACGFIQARGFQTFFEA